MNLKQAPLFAMHIRYQSNLIAEFFFLITNHRRSFEKYTLPRHLQLNKN